MLLRVLESYDDMSREAAAVVADRIRRKPNLVLGLATGSTPLGLYNELIRLHKDDGLSFAEVTTFNLDEYIGIPRSHDQSFYSFMREHLFNHLDIKPTAVHLPDGMSADIESHCEWYENEIQRQGGIDLQILGIGANGHLAFNEPGSSLGSRTRVKTLSAQTIQDNARFFRSMKEVPRLAVTMGMGTIMEAKELILLANGRSKASAIKAAVEGPITHMVPASIIQRHRKAYVFIDKEAASLLTHTFAT